MSDAPLLLAEGLTKHFPAGRDRAWRAVDGVSLSIRAGETLALVGESGCGKSTTGRLLIRLIEPSAGRVLFDGEDLLSLSPAALRARRRDMQIVFQDPYASLNPRLPVSEIIAEPIQVHGTVRGRAALREGGGVAGNGGPDCRTCPPLSAPVFRRPAPAHRHRARDRRWPAAGGGG